MRLLARFTMCAFLLLTFGQCQAVFSNQLELILGWTFERRATQCNDIVPFCQPHLQVQSQQ